MWEFSLTKALGIMAQTWPFIVFRMAVYFGIGLAYTTAIGTGAGTGWVFHYMSSEPDSGITYSFWGGAVGFGLVSAVLYWFREYILYLVKAGHIAVMTELLDGRAIPDGRSQIDYAQSVVRQRFTESSILFGIDQLIKGVLSAVSGTVNFLGSFIPVPGLEQVLRFVNAVIRVSLSYADELVLAYLLRKRTENPWADGQDALVLFAQNYWAFVKNAIPLTILMWVATILIFAVILTPAFALAYVLPGAFSGWGLAIAALFAWALKAAILEPLAIACLMQVFFKRIEGQAPDPEWRARLSQLSTKFERMKEKALAYAPKPRPAT